MNSGYMLHKDPLALHHNQKRLLLFVPCSVQVEHKIQSSDGPLQLTLHRVSSQALARRVLKAHDLS